MYVCVFVCVVAKVVVVKVDGVASLEHGCSAMPCPS